MIRPSSSWIGAVLCVDRPGPPVAGHEHHVVAGPQDRAMGEDLGHGHLVGPAGRLVDEAEDLHERPAGRLVGGPSGESLGGRLRPVTRPSASAVMTASAMLARVVRSRSRRARSASSACRAAAAPASARRSGLAERPGEQVHDEPGQEAKTARRIQSPGPAIAGEPDGGKEW